VGLLIIQLNWLPSDRQKGNCYCHPPLPPLFLHVADEKLQLDELGTWLFLSKFRHKVENVLQGWTFLGEQEKPKKQNKKKSSKKKKQKKKKRNVSEESGMLDAHDSHMYTLGR